MTPNSRERDLQFLADRQVRGRLGNRNLHPYGGDGGNVPWIPRLGGLAGKNKAPGPRSSGPGALFLPSIDMIGADGLP